MTLSTASHILHASLAAVLTVWAIIFGVPLLCLLIQVGGTALRGWL